ncbi:bublin coiled-coil protein [Microcaecilia unicolor]|uniref:UPF0184 protein C9orf16 homolog n=1 Tax=Microcaecilia unicolor TaxID=1415580 RepID=A0A6P7YBW4_9AMPH|nr:UPF0184 protein C9orf16 homolog [Microcaecilia unicolor]
MSGPNGDLLVPADSGDEEEYIAINSMLDQINSWLDHIEEKNDHLHTQLKELLESNRQARREFQQQVNKAQVTAVEEIGTEIM